MGALDGRGALVVGAQRGIGFACAEALAGDGEGVVAGEGAVWADTTEVAISKTEAAIKTRETPLRLMKDPLRRVL